MGDARARAAAEKDPPLLWLPEEISALILAEERRLILARQTQLDPGNTHVVDRCLITVPAYFGAEQIEATKEAGTLAGLVVMDLLQEPSAAAVYYCWKSKIQNGLFMVFDLGGGTFDVSVLRRQAGWSGVLGISGDNLLGGDDFDRVLAEYIRLAVGRDNPRCDLNLDMEKVEDRRIWEVLVFMAEGVKKALSRESAYLLRDTTLCDRRGARLNIDMKITRAQFEGLVAPLIDKCIPKCWEAIGKAKLKAGVSLAEVDQIFLVGGATHVPTVQREVRRRFCSGADTVPNTPAEIDRIVESVFGDDPAQTEQLRELVRDMMTRQERARCSEPMIDNPDLCVALGAAVQAGSHGAEVQGEHASVSITSPKTTSEATTLVAGKVTGEAGVNLQGAVAQLFGERVDVETPLDEEGAFAFRGVKLTKGVENSFDLRIVSATGQELATAIVTIAQVAEGSVRTAGPDSATTVSRPYALDVMHNGVLTRKVLVPSGASLPIDRQTHQLAVPDPNTGVIYFKVFQGFRLLKSIEAFVDPAVRPGALITFTFSVSRDHLMRATYQVAGDQAEHPVVIEPPDSLKPTRAEVSRVKDAIERELEYLDAVKRGSFQIRFKRLTDSAQEADEKGDEPKLIDRYEQLQGLHEEILREKVQLKPPLKEVEKSYGICGMLLDEIKKQQPDYADAEIRQNLKVTFDAAKAAYREKNQARYATHVETIQKAQKSLGHDYHRIIDEKVPLVKQAEDLIKQGLKEVEGLLQQADALVKTFEEKAKSETDPDAKSNLWNHAGQCGQCRDSLRTCQADLLELKGTYTSDPKAAIDKFYTLYPEIAHARNVLNQKASALDDQAPKTSVPVDLKG